MGDAGKGNKAIGHPEPTPPPGSGIGEQAEDGLVEEHRDRAPPLGGRDGRRSGTSEMRLCIIKKSFMTQ